MTERNGFKLFTASEFETWLNGQRIGRNISYVQEHHTYRPGYAQFTNDNHFELQQSMKNHHVNNNGWSDIGQHLSIFPDGTVMTGRSLERSPACIYKRNSGSVCIEAVGDFDTGGDAMTEAQKQAIVQVTAALCRKFSVPANTDKVVYHHWYNLSTGARNNGTGGNKSCPGTAFFGGNKVEDAEAHFLPLVRQAMGAPPPPPPAPPSGFGSVTATRLNVRMGPGTEHRKADDREPITYGSIVRIHDAVEGWLKISGSQPHWVSAQYVQRVKQGTVTASTLNVRSGPGTQFAVVDEVQRGEVVYFEEEQGSWARLVNAEKWLHTGYVDLT